MTDLRVATVGGRPITLSNVEDRLAELATGAAWPSHRTERRGGFVRPASLGRPGAGQRGGPRARGSGGGDRGGTTGPTGRRLAGAPADSPHAVARLVEQATASVDRQHAGRAVLLRPQPRPLSQAGGATRPAHPGADEASARARRSASRRRRRHGGARRGRLHRSGEPAPGRTPRRRPSRRIRRSARGRRSSAPRSARSSARSGPSTAGTWRGWSAVTPASCVPFRVARPAIEADLLAARRTVGLRHMAQRAARRARASSSPDTSTRHSQDTGSRATGIEETTLSETRAAGGNGRRR